MGVYRATSAVDAAAQVRTFEWKVIETSSVPLPHVAGGRSLGTIAATLVLTDSGGDTGYHESGLAFPIARGRFVAARAWSGGNAFACVVDGDGPVAQWHRRVARESVAGIRVEGNLPPARVSARRSGRFVRGAVSDLYRHPLVGASVVLERRSGQRWRVVSRGKTSRTGAYSLRLRAAGLYRVATSSGGATVRSRTVRG
jgi:hypothetical protein